LTPGEYVATIKTVPTGYTVITAKELTKEVEADKETEYAYKVEKQGSLVVTVKDAETDAGIPGVGITVTDEDGNEKTGTTDANGQVKCTELPEGNYTVQITDVPEDYKTPAVTSKTDEVVANEETSYEFELEKVDPAMGNLRIVVTEEQTNNPISGAKVKVTGPNDYEKIVTTETNGEVRITELEPGTYKTAIISVPNYYTVTTNEEITQAVKAGETTEYLYKVEKRGKIEIIIKDTDGEPVPNVPVNITDEDGNTIPGTTDDDGKVNLEELPEGEYTVTIVDTPDDYKEPDEPEKTKDVTPGDTTTYDFELEKIDQTKGSLVVKVVYEENGDPVSGVTVEITGPNGYSETARTDANGEIKRTELTPGRYTTTIVEVPNDYEVTTEEVITKEVKAAELTEYLYKIDNDTSSDAVGSLVVTVINETNGAKIPNAKVSIVGPNGYETTGITNSDGQIKIANLVPGYYSVTVNEVPDGYKLTTSSVLTLEVVANEETEYEFMVVKQANNNTDTDTDTDTGSGSDKGTGNLIIVVKDENTGKVVPGATVKVKDPDGNEKTYTTDSDGRIVLPNIKPGQYTIIITAVPSGYTVTTDKEIKKVVKEDENSYAEYLVNQKTSSTNPETNNTETGTSTGTETTTGTGSNSDQVSTGDSSNILFAIALLMFSLLGVSVLVVSKKKKH